LELTKQFFAQKGGACFPRPELHFQLDVAQPDCGLYPSLW